MNVLYPHEAKFGGDWFMHRGVRIRECLCFLFVCLFACFGLADLLQCSAL